MVFTSYQFFLFLPAVLFLYFIIPRGLRLHWLLLVSMLFYTCFHPVYLLVLSAVTGISWYAGLLLDRFDPAEVKARLIFRSGVLLSLLFLVVFKYTGFILENLRFLTERLLSRPVSLAFSLVMPVGISYYTFQVISYLADVRRGKIGAEKNILCYALYVSFFPKIISGPIERGEGFLAQIRDCRNWNLWNGTRVRDGLVLMIWGYFQKLVIADRLAILTGEVFGDYRGYGSVELFLAAAAFYIQLYADFNGYTDIARGVAKAMGFTLTENFRAPFFAKSIREYWKRWHISLSTWFREYVYIPLGGNRKGQRRTYVNLLIVFFLTGLWHGAGWNYILWGLYHGFFMVVERMGSAWKAAAKQNDQKKPTGFFSFLYTFLAVNFGWVFFRTGTGTALSLLARMFMPWRYVTSGLSLWECADYKTVFVLVCAVCGMGRFQNLISERKK